MNDLKLSEINITPLPSKNGLIGFANLVVNNNFKICNIGLHTCFSDPTGIRLVFPTREHKGVRLKTFYPINRATYDVLAVAISNSYFELMKKLR